MARDEVVSVVDGAPEPDRVEWIVLPSSGDEPKLPMPWSFGPLGDLLWLAMPFCRPYLVELACEHLHSSLPALKPLEKITDFDLVIQVALPWTRQLLLDRDLTEERDQLVDFLAAVIEHRPMFEYAIDMYYLDGLREPPYQEALQELSPRLYWLLLGG
ncbi:hypothetical protein [Micromonospora sp. NBC_01813]|uniref:hypothetical protein n=1 Tax=Micromonospora sp. NBC_01813 TaxID=2975988 RepID=UPI002DD94114|nr:hypothetical protein [Micromonospora sp. NBC_01813]WSA11175.1 hypothetical protein OG958_10590 [Micromonospora sp. NBC_01813]